MPFSCQNLQYKCPRLAFTNSQAPNGNLSTYRVSGIIADGNINLSIPELAILLPFFNGRDTVNTALFTKGIFDVGGICTVNHPTNIYQTEQMLYTYYSEAGYPNPLQIMETVFSHCSFFNPNNVSNAGGFRVISIAQQFVSTLGATNVTAEFYYLNFSNLII